MNKTNLGMVEYAQAQLGKPYWFGTFGQISTMKLYEEKKKQYPKYYTATDFKSQLGVKVHDCSGLIKGYLMSASPEAPAVYNSKYDFSANELIKKCTESGTIDTIPEIVGLVVWKNNHVGVYVGNGNVIEAKGHNYGVVKTKLSATKWLKWGKVPYFNYISTPEILFLTRLYRVVLDREPDESGMEFWLNKLKSGELTTSDVARDFLMSEEFINRNLSDEQFVTTLYRALFNREPDPDGFAFWMRKFATRTRVGIINGFLLSEEWANLCKKYGMAV